MANNEFGNVINGDDSKKNAVDHMASGYEKIGKSPALNTPSQTEQLKARNANGEELSPIELMTLGSAELDEKNRQQSQDKEKGVNDYMNPHNDQKKENEEYVKQSDYNELQRNMAALQNELDALAKGESNSSYGKSN